MIIMLHYDYVVIALQEIHLAFVIKIGSSDTIDVKELLYKDLFCLSSRIQVICICIIYRLYSVKCYFDVLKTAPECRPRGRKVEDRFKLNF